MLTIRYIPQESEPFSHIIEKMLRDSARVGDIQLSHSQGYTTISYQGPEGFWNPLDDCDNGDSGVWVFARVSEPDGMAEGEALSFLPMDEEADRLYNRFGTYTVSFAKAHDMTFWLLCTGEEEYYVAVEDRFFNTRNRRIISFINADGTVIPAVQEAAERPAGTAQWKPAAAEKGVFSDSEKPAAERDSRRTARMDAGSAQEKPAVDGTSPVTGLQSKVCISETPEFLFCRMCGKKIPGDSRFCMYCGVGVKTV